MRRFSCTATPLPLVSRLLLAMPFDTVVLNDGTRVRLSPFAPSPVSHRESTVSSPCVRNRNQVEGDRKPRYPSATLVALLTICPRTSQNTWSRPLKQASSTSTRLPVTCFPITPTGHGFNSQLSVYENEESVGVGLRQSELARSPVQFSARLTGLTVRKTGTTSTSPRNILGGTYASPSPPA